MTSVYAPAMDDAVVVKVVSGESEAEVVCGLLRSAGIECGYRDTDAVDSAFEDFIASGPREILVHQVRSRGRPSVGRRSHGLTRSGQS